MSKIYINEAKESWIVDRFRKEFLDNFSHLCTENIKEADVIWIIAPWTWKKIPKKYLQEKKILCTIHHLEEKELTGKHRKDFINRDKYVDRYHIISKKTSQQINVMSKINQIYAPFWINPENYFFINNKESLRAKYGFQNDEFLIGSFQRDSEGRNVNLPKLIKGPDRFIEIAKHYLQVENKKNIKIVLTGYRRNYIIQELKLNKIPYTYFEKINISSLNDLYNILDLYIVSSRTEGGPQSIVEAAITKTPIISTDVGIANEILHKDSIFDMNNFMYAQPDTEFAFNAAQKFAIPLYFKNFLNIFKGLID
jgi:glycosyltransferase involved in cell wall biosynthesis